MGVWDGGACARDDGAVKGDAVGLVGRGGVEGVLAQVLERGVGVEVALAVSLVAIGDVVGVGVLGACALGDSFSCGGDEFGACEVLEGAVGFGSCGVVLMRCWKWYTGCVLWCCPISECFSCVIV